MSDERAETDDSDDGGGDDAFETTVREGVCRFARRGTRWLSTGAHGGERVADAAYNVTVPEGWPETDLRAYVRERRERADFPDEGPALLTGVDQRHARRARSGPVEAVVTAGVSNPAALPVDGFNRESNLNGKPQDESRNRSDDEHPPGTVNVLLGTTRALDSGALANLVAVAAEAKAATLLAATGFPGTTTDAVVVGCDPAGERARFSGSATPVGSAARVCVRDATLAALKSRYCDENRRIPASVTDAEYGVVADERADVREP